MIKNIFCDYIIVNNKSNIWIKITLNVSIFGVIFLITKFFYQAIIMNNNNIKHIIFLIINVTIYLEIFVISAYHFVV